MNPMLYVVLALVAFAMFAAPIIHRRRHTKAPPPPPSAPPAPPLAYPPESILILLADDEHGEPSRMEYDLRDALLPVLQANGREILNPGRILARDNPDGSQNYALLITYCAHGLVPFEDPASVAELPNLTTAVVTTHKDKAKK